MNSNKISELLLAGIIIKLDELSYAQLLFLKLRYVWRIC